MKTLIMTIALAATIVAFGAEKTNAEKYAEAKTKNYANTMRLIAQAESNPTWKEEAFTVAKNVFDTIDPMTVTDDNMWYEETTMLDFLISRKTLTKDVAKTWLIEDKLCYMNYDYILYYNDTENVLAKKYIASALKVDNALKMAINVNDKDILIETGLAINFENGGAAIPTEYLNALSKLDVSYRSEDVLKVLKKMNQAFTLKMYEDGQEAKYKPLVTKIRALIEIR